MTGECVEKCLYEKIEQLLKYNPQERVDVNEMNNTINGWKEICLALLTDDIVLYPNGSVILKEEYDEVIESSFTDMEREYVKNIVVSKQPNSKMKMKNYYQDKIMEEYKEIDLRIKEIFKWWKIWMIICVLSVFAIGTAIFFKKIYRSSSYIHIVYIDIVCRAIN